MRFHRAILLSVLTLAACGSDEQSTREEFVAAADEVCAEHNDRTREQYEQMLAEGTPVSEEAFEDFAGEYAESYQAMVEDLEELPKPRDDAEVDRYMDRLERNADGVGEGDWESDSFAQSHQNSMREANSLAAAVGLEVCSPMDGF